ncbi:MAG: multidrug effflux MFS transporter [Aliishimia sp.]
MSSQLDVRFMDRSTPPHISTLILLAGLSAMVMNMFLPSLPTMTEHFDTSYGVMQLSVPVYLGISAVLQIFIGPISDNLGRRPVLLGGIALFCVATLGCIWAPTIELFLFFRMCQASIAVGMVLSRAVVRDMYEQDQAASMIGYVTMGMALVPMISPMIGGVLDEFVGWKANFWVFLAVGLLSFWMVWGDLGETAKGSTKSLMGQFAEYPELIESPRFWGYCLAAAFCSGSFFSYLGGGPFIGSVVFGLSPFWVGMLFGAPAVGYLIGNGLTGVFAARFGVNKMVLWGCLANFIGTTTSLSVFLAGYGTAYSFFGFMCFVGLGNGLVIANATAGMLSVRPHLAGTASGLGGAIMVGGGALLSAIAGKMLTPETGAYPLLWLQVITGFAALLSISYVIRRTKVLGIG